MGSGKKKIEIKKITKHSSRMVTFSKRRKGLFKKAHELQTRTGATVAIIVFSPAGKPYTYGDAALVNDAAMEAGFGSCGSWSNGGDGKLVGCDRVMHCGGYDSGFGGASSSAPSAISGVASNADVMGCNGVNAGCSGGFQIATSSSSVDMMVCNVVNVGSSGGFQCATSSTDIMGCDCVDVGSFGGFECATSCADKMGCNGGNVGCAIEEALNASWALLPVELYSDFQIGAYSLS